jgi:hypothetical protein
LQIITIVNKINANKAKNYGDKQMHILNMFSKHPIAQPVAPSPSKAQTAVNWMGKHKVEIGLAATATILAIGAITASILTGGIAGIIIGSVVGGAALATAAGSGTYGVVHAKNEAAKQKAPIVMPAQPTLARRMYNRICTKRVGIGAGVLGSAAATAALAWRFRSALAALV